MRSYPVPMALRTEEKLLGNILSLRQVVYLAAGILLSVIFFFPFRLIGGLLFNNKVGVIIGFGPTIFFMSLASIFAFAGAGALGILPGPRRPLSRDPYDAPIGLDQWLLLQWKYSQKKKTLPYKRGGYGTVSLPVGLRRFVDR